MQLTLNSWSSALKMFLRDLQQGPLTPKYMVSLVCTLFSSLSKIMFPALFFPIVYMIWPSVSAPNQSHPPVFLSTVIPCSLVLWFYLLWLKALALNSLSQCPILLPSFSNFSMPERYQPRFLEVLIQQVLWLQYSLVPLNSVWKRKDEAFSSTCDTYEWGAQCGLPHHHVCRTL